MVGELILKYQLVVAGIVSLFLAACSDGRETQAYSNVESGTEPEAASLKPWYQFQQVTEGARVYEQNCAACHGKRGEGAPNWRKAGADGKYPAPPLNGTGHAWHHPLSILFHTIKNGSPGGQGNMPAWGGKLNDDEIVSVIAWFQSRWPEEIYANWLQRDAAARARRSQGG